MIPTIYEIKILTLPDDHFELREEFFTKYSNGDLINLEMKKAYNEAKGVRKRSSLQREFFKHLGHFTDDDLKAFVQHLLGRSLNTSLPYPKVSVLKLKSVIVSHY